MVASRGRRWCWWLAGVVSCGTATSVVLVAGHHHQGCLLRSGPWSINLLWSRVAPLILLSQRQSWNGAEWSKDKTQVAESIKWRPQQAYGSNQFYLFSRRQFSAHSKSSRSRIDKRTARATGNTRYRYSKIAPLDHKMADNCVSLARTNTLSSTITKLIKTSKTSNKSYSYHLLNRINKMYTHDLFYLHKEWEAWFAPVYIQIRTTKSQLTQCTKYKCH